MSELHRTLQPDALTIQTVGDVPIDAWNEAELSEALAVGDADIEAGRIVPFEEVAAELRRNYGQA